MGMGMVTFNDCVRIKTGCMWSNSIDIAYLALGRRMCTITCVRVLPYM